MGLFNVFKKKDDKKSATKAAPKTEKEMAPASYSYEKTEEPIAKKPSSAKPSVKVESKAPAKTTKPAAEKAKAEEKPKTTAKPATKSAPKAEKVPAKPVANETKAKPASKASAPVKEAKSTTAKTKTETKTAPKTEEKKESASFAGKFEIKKSKDGKFVFNLYAANSVIVATSQIYSSSAAAQNGIKSVIENAERANIEDQTLKKFESQNFPKWEIYLDKGEQYRFRLSAPNGSCICHSQGYTSKASCKNGIESIIRTAKNAAVDKAYIKKD